MSLASLPLRLGLPLRGPRADAHAAPAGRPRGRAPRLRAGALLGDQGHAGQPGRGLRGGSRQGPLRLAGGHGDGAGAGPGRPGRGHGVRSQAPAGQGAAAVQHHGAHERLVWRRRVAGARHARRRIAVPGRPHQLPAYRQHGVPALAGPARQRAGPHRLRAGGGRRQAPRVPGQVHAHARQAPHHGPPADLPGGRAQEGAERRSGQGLRPGGAPLPGHAAAAGRDRAPEARRAPRRRAVRGARQPRFRTGLPRGLRAVRREARPPAAVAAGRRRAAGARAALGGQRDAAARPLRPGPAHREDGGARPGHQGHARRHHPAPLRPQLRARQPRGAHRAGHGAHRRLRRGHDETRPSTSAPPR